jgi:hypothetical protein
MIALVIRIRQVVLTMLALAAAGASTAHAAESPLAAALKKSAAQPRAQLEMAGRCELEEGKRSHCSVRIQSDRAAGYHYYRAFFGGVSVRTVRVSGRNHMDSGMFNLMAEALADPDEKAKKLPLCWLSEERVREDASEGWSISTLSVAEGFRQMRADMRGGTITRSGRTITRVKGAERATLALDAQGRLTGGVIEDPDDGRYRMTVTYPDSPFMPVSPTPECTDEQLGDDGDQAA